jgi:glutamate racemase
MRRTARVPYGTKSVESVVRYATQATDYLVRRGVKLLVVACNAASARVYRPGPRSVRAAAVAASRSQRLFVLEGWTD